MYATLLADTRFHALLLACDRDLADDCRVEGCEAIMAWHDLITNLGTLTINEVALPLGPARTFQMLARPTSLQEQAYALLAVPLPRVQ